MIKGKRLHDMMCSISDTYLPLYVEKSLGNKLAEMLRCGYKIEYNQDGYSLIKKVIDSHLIKKGFI